MALRTIPIRRAANRSNLFMGGDREVLMCVGLGSAVLIFAAQDWAAFFVGIAAWFASLWAFRKMGKADPEMRSIYRRSLRYKPYYPPRATPFRNNTAAQGKQYE